MSIVPISIDHLELLREWKNQNRDRFFHKDTISIEQQQEWFNGYVLRPYDFMFLAFIKSKIAFGCLGARIMDESEWDIYNVINGLAQYRGQGYMREALGQLLSFCEKERDLPVRLRVLRDNPARHWYLRNHFRIVSQAADFWTMEYSGGVDRPMPLP